MSKPKGYKRGLALFFIISISTFTLLFIFGQKDGTRSIVRRMAIVTVDATPETLKAGKELRLWAMATTNVVYVESISRQYRAKLSGLDSTASVRDRDSYRKVVEEGNLQAVVLISKKNGIRLLALQGEKEQPLISLPRFLSGMEARQGFQQSLTSYLIRPVAPPGLLDCLSWINPWFLMVALFFWLLNLLSDSYLLKVLLRSVDDDMPFLQCCYAFLGNEFLTAVTPFQSGGQPLMVYIMHKNRVSVGKGILITFFKTAGQIYFFALIAPVVLFIWPEFMRTPGLTAFYIYGILFFGYFLTLTIFIFFKPHAAKRVTMRFFKFLRRFRFFRKKNLTAGLRKTLKEINVFSFFIKTILKKKRITFLWLFLLTAVSWAFKFMVAIAVIWGLGEAINIAKGLGGQAVTNFLSFFAPTPGGSGVFEFTTNAIFKKVLSRPELLFVFVVIWRFITYYLSVVLGALVVIKVLKIKKNTLDEEEIKIEKDLSLSPANDYIEK